MRTGSGIAVWALGAMAVNISGEAWAFLGVCVTSVVGGVVALTKSRTAAADSTAAAKEAALPEQVNSLGDRLDKQNERLDRATERIDDLEAKVRGFREYVAQDHDAHRRNGWPIVELPEELR